jgi:DNA-binding NarL/FixJ family response regulator
MTINVLIADDHPLIREGLSKILSLNDDIKIIGEARDGREAVKMTMKTHPDVVLMDINMPHMNGIEAARVIKSELPQTGIIALTIHDDQEYIDEMIESGVSGFLLKDVEPETLVQSVREVSKGKSLFEEDHRGKKTADRKTYLKRDGLEELTRRELDVLQLIAKGMCNKDIAESLFISEKTVKNHLTNIFRKINVDDRTQAALFAIKKGIVKL